MIEAQVEKKLHELAKRAALPLAIAVGQNGFPSDLRDRVFVAASALPPGPVRDLRRILARPSGGGLEAAMTAETEATVRGFLDPKTVERVAGFG